MRCRKITVLFVMALLGVCCTPQKDLIEYTPSSEKDGGGEFEPLDDSGLKALFYLDIPSDCISAKTGHAVHSISEKDVIYSRMENYTPQLAQDGRYYVEVPSSQTHNYRMFLYPEGQKGWYVADAPLYGLVIPYSQFYASTLEQLSSFPLCGEYTQQNGNTMVLRDVYAVLEVNIKGNAQISSVHLQNNEKDVAKSFYMAGIANYGPETGYKVDEGVNFVNLNCMDSAGNGVAVTPSGKTFYLAVAPGNYQSGMTLSVSDTRHKAVDFEVPPFEVAAGQVKSLGEFDYSPAANLLMYERFDNFVWGGNVRDTEGLFTAFAPDASANPDENPASRSGFENALTKVSRTTAGSALIQSTFTSGYTVDQRHAVSSEYIASRNIGGYNYLYRCQEYQGCISAGAGDGIRGLVDMAHFEGLDAGIYKAVIEFDIAYRYGSTDEFMLQLSKSGIVRNVTIDGEPMQLQTEWSIEGNNTHVASFVNKCLMGRKDLPAPSSFSDEAGWHHVRAEAWNLCEVTLMNLQGATTDAALKHGFFLDNVKITAEPMPRGNLRVLFMNIQNGMWADQPNNFDNFVAWVKKYDPDICVWCEARTLYKPGTDTAVSSDAERILCKTKGSATDEGWKNLAARYGHQYYAISGFRDNYPQVITSRFPITCLGAYTDINGKTIQHGAGMYSLDINGKTLKIVSLHLWPQLYSPTSYTLASAAALEGRDYQVVEIDNILAATSPDASDYYLMMGDTNGLTRRDAWYYEANHLYEVVSRTFNNIPIEFTDGVFREKWYWAHDRIIANGMYDDMLHEFWPGKFFSSTGGAGRIDFMYGTPAMTSKLVNMLPVHDSWSTIVSDTAPFSFPSDHLPILADFNF